MLDWFKARTYRHFDFPVDEAFAKKVLLPTFIAQHPFSPLLYFSQLERRYKKCPKCGTRSITEKARPIMYASHRDACIFSYYAHQLNSALTEYYHLQNLNSCVIAYRSLGRSNYHFASEAMDYAKKNSPVTILAFDVTGFFDNLDHGLLKQRLKRALKVDELTADWYQVFRAITQFRFVDKEDLRKNTKLGPRMKNNSYRRIASIEELKSEGISFHCNAELAKGKKRGIPQGTPLSAAASNLYMMDFDASANEYCTRIGAFYRRYSDDILVICKNSDSAEVQSMFANLITAEKLEFSPHKTEKTEFDLSLSTLHMPKSAQYLGFSLRGDGASIRESSLSRQWRKLKRAIKRTDKIAQRRVAAGMATKAYTKKLYRRFSNIKVNDGTTVRPVRNFSSYARRSAEAFGSDEKITNQIKRLERAARQKIEKLKLIVPP